MIYGRKTIYLFLFNSHAESFKINTCMITY
nr:MAG TPA: hypothetical protein [Caudoviricetes sp.]